MEMLTTIIGGATGAALVAGVFSVITFYLNRNAKKEDKLDEISRKLDAHCKADDERYIKQCRTRILRFNDEIIRGVHHTQEHFNNVLDDVTEYTRYCDENKDFKNEQAVEAITNVRRVYRHCEETDGFLK